MEPLTLDQMAAKVLYLERENAQLRAESLDLKVRAGLIRLATLEPAKTADVPDERGGDG
jgi:hypothetical protein